MARLLSEDTECVSSLELAGSQADANVEDHPGQTWQRVDLTLVSGDREITEACLLCRLPADEVGNLVELLSDLTEGKRDEIIFEPAEPSFELTLTRTREGGIKAEAWLDAGNASTGFYRWDAAGIRFYTTIENLSAFMQALKQEFLSKAYSS